MGGFYAVDLDATLAYYDGWRGEHEIGAPIPLMVDRVKRWLAEGKEVKIFTARVSHDPDGSVARAIQDWCERHIGQRLEVTNVKTYETLEIWDDRAVAVERNTGRILGCNPEER